MEKFDYDTIDERYSSADVVHALGSAVSVEEMLKSVWENSGDNQDWKVEDELQEWHRSFEGGKKYVVRCTVGSRGFYGGFEIIREGTELFESDLLFGTDFWMLRKREVEYLENKLRKEVDKVLGSNKKRFKIYSSTLKDKYGCSKEVWVGWKNKLQDLYDEYSSAIKIYKEGSNDDINEESLCSCINDDDWSDIDGDETTEESGYYYFLVDRLRENDSLTTQQKDGADTNDDFFDVVGIRCIDKEISERALKTNISLKKQGNYARDILCQEVGNEIYYITEIVDNHKSYLWVVKNDEAELKYCEGDPVKDKEKIESMRELILEGTLFNEYEMYDDGEFAIIENS